mmetsp:Transcript_42497/g.98496  ORF Transcript_42497/g.98496 Transcript_42497/m.98496 type:complete len:504 (-) Transcript_42497:109-1620(-)
MNPEKRSLRLSQSAPPLSDVESSEDSDSEGSVSSDVSTVGFIRAGFLKDTWYWHRESILLRRLYPNNTGESFLLTMSLVILKYAMPALVTGLCLFISMFLMHIGTHVYVQQMLEFDAKYVLRNTTSLPTQDGIAFSYEKGFGGSSIGALEDPLTGRLGYKHFELGTLDKMAMLFPMSFVMLALLVDDLGCWTRVFVCHGLLALGKGIMSCLTIVPDSAGWEACKARLKEDGVEWMEQRRSIGEIFMLELRGVTGGGGMRWCADMMYSGHTYFVTLYALGVYELVRNSVLGKRDVWKRLLLTLVGTAGVLQQAFEIHCVLLNHFHYTSDVVMAVVMTFLFYTNSSIAVGTRNWVEFLVTWPGSLDPDRDEENPKAVPHSYYFDQNREPALKNSPADERTLRPWVWSFDTAGEVFVPICCCLCTGHCNNVRRYVFNDDDIIDLMATIRCGHVLEDEDIRVIQKRLRMKTRVNPKEIAIRTRQVAASFGEREGSAGFASAMPERAN